MTHRLLIIAISGFLVFQICCEASILESAHSAFLEGRFSDALMHYSKILTDSSVQDLRSEAMYMAGLCYLEIGNKEMGLRVLWQLLSDYPQSNWTDNACLQLAKIKEKEDRSKLGEALMLYEMIPARFPGSELVPVSLLGAARMKQQLGFYEEANLVIVRALEHGADLLTTAENHLDIAAFYSHPKNPKRQVGKALKHLNTITTQFGGSKFCDDAYIMSGNLLWEIGQTIQSIQAFKNVIILSSSDHLTRYAQERIAEILFENGQREDAAAAFNALLSKYAISKKTRTAIQKKVDELSDEQQKKPTVSAWNASIEGSSNGAIYSGDVRIELGKTTILSDVAEVDFVNNTINASGHVRLQWNDRYVINGDELKCRVNDRIVDISGNVTVMIRSPRNNQRTRHKKIQLSLSTGEIQ